MSLSVTNTVPFFSNSARWVLRLLSWLAFGVTAYLAWHAMHQTPVAGCSVGGHAGCDAVLNSAWSKWLGIPVAVLGLACYATLAALSVLLGVQSSASRWINTAFIAFALLVAGASLWFIGLQVIAIGEFCKFCLTADIAGILIGAIVGWSIYRSFTSSPSRAPISGSSTNLAALRSALPAKPRAAAPTTTTGMPTPVAPPRIAPPAGARTVPLVGGAKGRSRAYSTKPSLPIALGSGVAVLIMLIAAQVAFPTKAYEVQQLALTDSIDMAGDETTSDTTETSTDVGNSHVALRIPTEQVDGSVGDAETQPENTNDDRSESPFGDTTDESSASLDTPSPSDEAVSGKKRERKVSFLGGKLTLDTYKHPVIGSPEAPHVVVEVVSYDCPHCRKTSKTIKRAMSRYGDQVAVIVLVIPLESKCNKLVDPAASKPGACSTARMALGVAALKPTAFARFHDYLMSGSDETPPPVDSVVAKAYKTVNSTELRKLRDSDQLEKQIEANVNLFEKLRRQNASKKEFGLPIQILGDHVLTGTVEKPTDLYEAWEEHLGVKPE